MTEFRPVQEQKCEESFWKSCKITFRETAYNYTIESCVTPLVKKCDAGPEPRGGAPVVCRTWQESECNTTYLENGVAEAKPATWCSKRPRKICAPDNCKVVQGNGWPSIEQIIASFGSTLTV